jgi:putative endonuclease
MFVYILTNDNKTTLYIGVTNDLSRRIEEHKNNIIKGFCAKYNLHKLVYFEVFSNPEEAISREKQLKNWHRPWKDNLINDINPEWEDISRQLL